MPLFRFSRINAPHIALLAIILSCLAAGSRPAVSAETANRPPNIVLIVSDDQGYHDLGITNDELVTPNLNRLANEGIRLTSFYVPWPACTPSRAGFLTGRYPQRNGIYDMIRNEAPDYGHAYNAESYAVSWERIGGMDTREITVADLLRTANYYNGIFGKWDLGVHRRFLPLQRGWHEFFGLVNTGIDYYTHERYGVPSMYRDNDPTTEGKGTYVTSLFEQDAIRFIDENHARPFFLYVPFNAPHGASSLDPKIRGRAQAPDRWRKLYPGDYDNEAYVDGRLYNEPAQRPNRAMRRSHYRGAISAMDAAIGSILDRLDQHGIAENTFVIFFSDNGGAGVADNGPLRGGKGEVFEGGIRVCFLARFPGRIAPGTTSDAFLTGLDLMPTLLNLAGVQPPSGLVLDGFDMMPVLTGEAPSPRKAMFWKRREREAARVGDWKWIRNGKGEFLFNLTADLREQNNLFAENPEKADELRRAFNSWLREVMVEAEPRRPFKDF